MSFENLLNRSVTVKRRETETCSELNEPIPGPWQTVETNVSCRIRITTANRKRELWGIELNVTYEAFFLPTIDIKEGDLIEDQKLGALVVKGIRQDSSSHHKLVGLE